MIRLVFIRKSGQATQIFQFLLWAVSGSGYVRSAHGCLFRHKSIYLINIGLFLIPADERSIKRVDRQLRNIVWRQLKRVFVRPDNFQQHIPQSMQDHPN